MAHKVRVQFPEAIYHVMNRGDHQKVTLEHATMRN